MAKGAGARARDGRGLRVANSLLSGNKNDYTTGSKLEIGSICLVNFAALEAVD